MLEVFGRDENTVNTVGLVAMIPSFIVIAISIIVTESTLKEQFDKDGKKKK